MRSVLKVLSVGLICCFCAVSLIGAEVEEASVSEWKPLFNGKDLNGFTTYLEKIGKDTDPAKIFQVENGVIHLYKDSEEATKVSRGYFATEGVYSHYHLR